MGVLLQYVGLLYPIYIGLQSLDVGGVDYRGYRSLMTIYETSFTRCNAVIIIKLLHCIFFEERLICCQ
jgi:hypothetical protein